ncbi:phospholipase A2 inhibitor and Ly6/PLAUR domain-containing protein-like [Pyxicephalus adspersus]|uniref:phospholipase A2 inhibitor and Ly6/PLAUR domain-containing protein-like n=1 Tax=Pyxicephalus adspersus TaxID=30357 RepID=UPI003B5A42B4
MRLTVGTIIGIVGICVLMGRGQALRCWQCSSYNDTNCNGKITECPASLGACATTLIRNRGLRWTSYFQIKSCVNMSECFSHGRVTGLYEEKSFNTSCCFSDNCNTYVPALPVVNLTLNGLLCPSYVATRMEPCDFKNVSACTGDQDRCVRYSSTTTIGSSKSSLFFGGCASESVCVTEKSFVSADDVSFEMKRTCYNSASRLAYGMPVIFLILKALIGSYIS